MVAKIDVSGLSALEVAERCVEFFNSINNEYDPLTLNQIPTTFDSEPMTVSPRQVESEIVKGKRPKSRFPGDVFVNTIVDNVKTLSPIIASIYNVVF